MQSGRNLGCRSDPMKKCVTGEGSEAQGEGRLLEFPRRRERGASYSFRGAGRGATPTVSEEQEEGRLLQFPRRKESLQQFPRRREKGAF